MKYSQFPVKSAQYSAPGIDSKYRNNINFLSYFFFERLNTLVHGGSCMAEGAPCQSLSRHTKYLPPAMFIA
jgi:hypothetical protein